MTVANAKYLERKNSANKKGGSSMDVTAVLEVMINFIFKIQVA